MKKIKTHFFVALLTVFILMAVSPKIKAQNCDYITNGGFENYNPCPIATSWFKPNFGTSDFANENCPSQNFVIQGPHSGKGRAGFYVLGGNETAYGREYLSQKLSTPLVQGKQYRIKLFATGYWSEVPLEVYLSNQQLGPYNSPYFIANAQISKTITPNQWFEINELYTAVGGEEYINLGYFKSNPTNNQSYVTIDDVSITDASPLQINAGNDQTTCIGNAVTLGGQPTAVGGSNDYTYQWTPSTGLDDTQKANPECNPSEIGVYNYSLTVSTPTCSLTDEVEVKVIGCCNPVIETPQVVTLVNPDGLIFTGGLIGESTNPLKPITTIYINGPLTIQGNTTLICNNVIFGSEGEIIIEDGYTLTIQNGSLAKDQTHLYTCGDFMWKGIKLSGPDARLVITGNSSKTVLIEDALRAVEASNGAQLDFQYAEFNKNHEALVIKDFYITSGDYPAIIRNSIFDSYETRLITNYKDFLSSQLTTLNGTKFYGKFPVTLKKPFKNQLPLHGILVYNVSGMADIHSNDGYYIIYPLDKTVNIDGGNNFANLQTGLHSTYSSITIANSSFEYCNTGIDILGDHISGIRVFQNSFKNITNYGVHVIDSISYNFSDPTFYRYFQIGKNTFTASPNATAIYQNNQTQLYSNGKGEVWTNSISGFKNGIIWDGIAGNTSFHRNIISLTRGNNSVQNYGIKLSKYLGGRVQQNQVSGASNNSLYCAISLCGSCIDSVTSSHGADFHCNDISKVEIGIEVNSTLSNFTMYSNNRFLDIPSKAYVKVGTGTTTLNYQSFYNYPYTVLPATTTFNFVALLAEPFCPHIPDLDLTSGGTETLHVSEQLNGISGVSEITKQTEVSFYPNPAGNLLFVGGVEQLENISLYNNLGNLVMRHKPDAGNELALPASLTNGVYTIKAQTKNGTVIHKNIVILR